MLRIVLEADVPWENGASRNAGTGGGTMGYSRMSDTDVSPHAWLRFPLRVEVLKIIAAHVLIGDALNQVLVLDASAN